ncbi:hypothetical protein FRAAL4004 [Frankia alni ACN14a]|uniref:Uncharacterized protein n=1 Tax=Frankia alni (strain DSM 45986 / CECT 9034 / ACN14a) TaxID=326424 RepID=Q0RAL5_FRAAA|nr:hypothetical protein FRAAL4004 [Frankia alni ACN14a]
MAGRIVGVPPDEPTDLGPRMAAYPQEPATCFVTAFSRLKTFVVAILRISAARPRSS